MKIKMRFQTIVIHWKFIVMLVFNFLIILGCIFCKKIHDNQEITRHSSFSKWFLWNFASVVHFSRLTWTNSMHSFASLTRVHWVTIILKCTPRLSHTNSINIKCWIWMIGLCLDISNQRPLKRRDFKYLIRRNYKQLFAIEIS